MMAMAGRQDESETLQATREVEQLMRAVGEQLGLYRRRALAAEQRVRVLEEERAATADRLAATVGERDALVAAVADATRTAALMHWPDGLPSPEQVATLRQENGQLRERLAEVSQRTRVLVDRVRFVRQQVASDPSPPSEESAS
jgi:hypothetical protein